MQPTEKPIVGAQVFKINFNFSLQPRFSATVFL